MPRKTVLQLVNDVLPPLGHEEVSSISESPEAVQIAWIARDCYEEMVDEMELSHKGELLKLKDASTVELPAILKIPDSVSRVEWINYDIQTVTAYPIDRIPSEPIIGGLLTALSPEYVSTAESGYPYGLAIHPDDTFVYVTSDSESLIYQYEIGNDGALTPSTPPSVATSGLTPEYIAIHPSGDYAYVVDYNNSTVSTFNIVNGLLEASSDPDLNISAGPFWVSVHPSGNYLYTVGNSDETISQFSISGGTLSPLSPQDVSTGAGPYSMTISPDGAYAYVANADDNTISQYSVGIDGQLTPLSPATVATGEIPQMLAITPDGAYAYVTNWDTETVSIYSVSSGLLTYIDDQPVGEGLYGITTSPDGSFLYVGVEDTDNPVIAQFAIGEDGLLTELDPATVVIGENPQVPVFTSDGLYMYVATLGNGPEFQTPRIYQYTAEEE